MITTIIDKGKEHTFVTQQYETGLYVIIDSDPAQQRCSKLSEAKFHKKLREDFEYIPAKSTQL